MWPSRKMPPALGFRIIKEELVKRLSTGILVALVIACCGLSAVAAPSPASSGNNGNDVAQAGGQRASSRDTCSAGFARREVSSFSRFPTPPLPKATAKIFTGEPFWQSVNKCFFVFTKMERAWLSQSALAMVRETREKRRMAGIKYRFILERIYLVEAGTRVEVQVSSHIVVCR